MKNWKFWWKVENFDEKLKILMKSWKFWWKVENFDENSDENFDENSDEI